MAVYFLDANGVERIKRACKKVLDDPVRVPPDQQLPYYPHNEVHHAVYVTSGTATDGRYPGKLQFRAERGTSSTTPTWADFDPTIDCWAIGFEGEALEADTRYHGMLASEHTDGLPVFACVVGGGVGEVAVRTQDGRLSLSSTEPVTLADATSATIYFHRFSGDQISLYYNSAWDSYTIPEAGVSVAAGSGNHDIFAYYTGSAVALEKVAWSGDTSRAPATALARQNGVLVKSGDATRRYLGTARDNPCSDTDAKRFLWNAYHGLRRKLKKCTTFADGWQKSSSVGNWSSAGGSTSWRVEVVIGLDGHLVDLTCNEGYQTDQDCSSIETAHILCGIDEDGTTGNDADCWGATTSRLVNDYAHSTAKMVRRPSAGYHYYQWTEYTFATFPSGTVSLRSSAVDVNGLVGWVEEGGSAGGSAGVDYQDAQNIIGVESFTRGIVQATAAAVAPSALAAWGTGKDQAQTVVAGQVFGW